MREIHFYQNSWTLSWTVIVYVIGGVHSQERQGYLIAAPSVFHAGVEEAVSVTLFKAVDETRVQVYLSVKGETVAHGHGTVRDKGTIKLKVPSHVGGQALLTVWGNRHLAHGGYVFHNHTTVTVDSKGTAVFIQTDKPIYKPRHKVLINVYTITPDMRPASDKIEAYVVDPRGSRMVQWKDLKPVCCGVVNVSFPLSDQPVFGEWLVFVEVQGHTYNKTFEVQKYVTPKFELTVEPPPFVRDLNTCEQVTVKARYTFGKPVTGKLTVNMTVNGVGYYRHEAGHPVVKTTEIKGSATFSLCVKEMMPVDVTDHFRGTVNMWVSVSSVDGGQQTMFDDSTAVHKQLIDIKYSKDTRKQFKPGLPYKGKIEVMYPDGSPADGVVVRVKAELTPRDSVYTSELTSRNGEASFEIPAIPTAAQYAWLETKVIAIDGKPAGDQYLPSYLSISSWYSPSKCHIQLQSPAVPLTIGQEAELSLKSTCPCNFTLHYEVTARGNIVQSGHRHPNSTGERTKRAAVTFDKNIHTTPHPPLDSAGEAERPDSCVSTLRFPVLASMAPLSRLLVYYVREDGEGVSDSLHVPVVPRFENQVSVSVSTNESVPGGSVSLRVRGEKGSCVCVATVDKSMYLLKPGFRLTAEKVFEELADFDVSDAFGVPKDDGHFWWPGLASRRRRSSVFPWHWDITKDARFAFTETGLLVMTDMVQLNHRQTGGVYTDEGVPAFQPHTAAQAVAHTRTPPRAVMHRRTFFPETWIWHCLNVSDVTGEAVLRLDVPDSITTWVTEAIGLSEEKGLGLAETAELRTFKPFFIDFTLPYSMIRGEQTKVSLTVYNYLPTCAEVHVKVSVPKGIKFVGHPGKHHLTRKKCVAPGEAAPTFIVLSFMELVTANITARAVAYSEPSCCSEGLQAGKANKAGEEQEERRSPVAVDYVRRSVLVEPEGLPREYTYSVFFCPNERIHISTPNKYEYQYLKKPSKVAHIQVAVKSHNDAHIALSPSAHDSTEMVEVVLGGRQNSRSWISVGKMGEPVASVPTPGLLSWDEFRSFWISWRGEGIQVGYGLEPSSESLILQWAGRLPTQVQYIGFSTGWGSAGEFKIWRKEDADENHNEAFTLGVPHNAVPGSERATASMIGDVMGPTLNNLDKLLRLPFGCGEQNMIHFAPNVFVLKYLQKTHQLTPEVEAEATDYLLQGYQRQLTYKRQDGSYSAFGERDSSGSMWLTAFVLKSFAQSRGFIFIDPEELQAAKAWLISHQRDEGSFPAMGRILNKDLQGGIHGKISLTAYVVAALLETGITTEEEKQAVAKAKVFLESNTYSADDPYTTALSAYALALLRSPHAPLALRRLNHMAITQDGFTHWSLTGSIVSDEDSFMGFSDGLLQSVVSAEVEMTAYGLLTYTLLGDVASSLPVVKWLSQQRNALGGFSSTQDTCVALQALSEYAILSYMGGVNLTISLASTNLDFQETFELQRDNKKILQKAVIPSIPTGLFVSAKGEGCCLMQIDVSYNVPDPVAKPAFQLRVELKETRQEPHVPPSSSWHASARSRSRANNRSELSRGRRSPADDEDPAGHQDRLDYRLTLEACTRWLHPGSSNMAVLEIPLLSGFRADVESLERLLLDKRVGLKRYEMDGRKVLFYFDEIPSQCMTCVTFQSMREYVVGKTAPVPVKVYDYYEPAFEATRFYNVSESSPLARELCDGTSCNEVESSTNQWTGFVQGGQCNNVFGCPEEERYEQCTCYRDCGYDGEPVCGSDGQLYQNQCQLEASACRNGTRIEQVPLGQCPQMVDEVMDEEGDAGTGEEPEKTLILLPTGEAEQGSMPEVSYYSYDYDPDTETFLSEEEEQLGAAEVGEEAASPLGPLDGYPLTVDTKHTPER
ncbi:C3 and PZP-like alpha-2-macroglobulin domain-containing protein 8 isoform X3 [Brachyhypopomus gauderio]